MSIRNVFIEPKFLVSLGAAGIATVAAGAIYIVRKRAEKALEELEEFDEFHERFLENDDELEELLQARIATWTYPCDGHCAFGTDHTHHISPRGRQELHLP